MLTPAGRLGLAAFNALLAARARNLLRHEWLGAGFRAPDTRWIDEARHQLASTDALSKTCLKTPEGELCVYRGEIYVARHRPDTSDAVVHWRGEDELPWAGGRVRFVVVMAVDPATTGAGVVKCSFVRVRRRAPAGASGLAAPAA